jgi:hypothetical protein
MAGRKPEMDPGLKEEGDDYEQKLAIAKQAAENAFYTMDLEEPGISDYERVTDKEGLLSQGEEKERRRQGRSGVDMAEQDVQREKEMRESQQDEKRESQDEERRKAQDNIRRHSRKEQEQEGQLDTPNRHTGQKRKASTTIPHLLTTQLAIPANTLTTVNKLKSHAMPTPPTFNIDGLSSSRGNSNLQKMLAEDPYLRRSLGRTDIPSSKKRESMMRTMGRVPPTSTLSSHHGSFGQVTSSSPTPKSQDITRHQVVMPDRDTLLRVKAVNQGKARAGGHVASQAFVQGSSRGFTKK